MQDDKEQKYRDVLTPIGFRQDQINYILSNANDKKARKLYLIGCFAYILLMIACMIGYVFIARAIFWEYLMQERTQGIDYSFYDSLWEVHIIPMMIIGILLPCWGLYKLISYFPKASALLSINSLNVIVLGSAGYDLNGTWASSRWFARKLIDDKFHSLPIEQGLVYLNTKTQRWIALWMGGLMIITLPLMILDGLNYKLITKDGITERAYGTLEITQKSWNDVSKVETGCYYFPGKSSRLKLTYNVHFNDGSHIDLFEAESEKEKITQIRIVDNILRQLGKPFSIRIFTYGIPKGKPYVNDACFPKLQKYYPNQYSEILQLLRLEEYSAN